MSIATEITRLQNAKASIKNAIINKGGTNPGSATLDSYPTYINSIPSGGGSDKHYLYYYDYYYGKNYSLGTTSGTIYYKNYSANTISINGTTYYVIGTLNLGSSGKAYFGNGTPLTINQYYDFNTVYCYYTTTSAGTSFSNKNSSFGCAVVGTVFYYLSSSPYIYPHAILFTDPVILVGGATSITKKTPTNSTFTRYKYWYNTISTNYTGVGTMFSLPSTVSSSTSCYVFCGSSMTSSSTTTAISFTGFTYNTNNIVSEVTIYDSSGSKVFYVPYGRDWVSWLNGSNSIYTKDGTRIYTDESASYVMLDGYSGYLYDENGNMIPTGNIITSGIYSVWE